MQRGQGPAGLGPQHSRVRGDLAEVEQLQVEEAEGGLEGRQGPTEPIGVPRGEEAGHGHLAGAVAQQAEGDVGHHPGPVAGDLVGIAAAPVFHAGQGPEGVVEDLSAGLPRAAGDEADAAGGVVGPEGVQHGRVPGCLGA